MPTLWPLVVRLVDLDRRIESRHVHALASLIVEGGKESSVDHEAKELKPWTIQPGGIDEDGAWNWTWALLDDRLEASVRGDMDRVAQQQPHLGGNRVSIETPGEPLKRATWEELRR